MTDRRGRRLKDSGEFGHAVGFEDAVDEGKELAGVWERKPAEYR